MKLRLRSLESKETIRIEVPDSCTLQHLKDFLIQRLSSSSAATLSFSLNRKDELQESSPDDLLSSMDVTSGDLIFYTFNRSEFSSQRAAPSKSPVSDASLSGASSMRGPEFMEDEGEKKMDWDCEKMDVVDESITGIEKNCSKPTFLRRMLKEELGHDRNAHKLLVTSVHAVLLESGFVLVNSNLGFDDHPFHIPENWPSSSFTMSLCYTLPELLVKGDESSTIRTVSLKFQSLGHFVNVYGSLSGSRGSCVYRVSLNDKTFAPYLDLIWANSQSSYIIDEIEGNADRQVFEFWKVVKDALALPLLIDLCEKTGLPPPASFMRLPGDLKLKILGALPGVDIGRVECVCTELRFLASSNDLWKLKFNQEFGCREEIQGNGHWKAKYVASLEHKKLRDRAITRRRGLNFRRPYRPGTMRRLPYPFACPRLIGGDHDTFPALIHHPFGPPRQGSSRGHLVHGFLANCDLMHGT